MAKQEAVALRKDIRDTIKQFERAANDLLFRFSTKDTDEEYRKDLQVKMVERYLNVTKAIESATIAEATPWRPYDPREFVVDMPGIRIEFV